MKKIQVAFVAIGILFLVGCEKKDSQNQGGTSATTQKESVGSSVISSIKDAMNLGKNMECIYTTKIGDKEIKAVMQTNGKNFKSSSELEGRKMYTIMKDDVVYTWGEGIPMASKLAMSCIEEITKDMPKNGDQQSAPSVQDPKALFDNATNVVCNPIASIDLSIPSDIQFQDMCEMMKGFANIKIPAGTVPVK